MKIVADENMVGVEALFSGMGDITFLPGREISHQALMDADVLLVRSVTRVDQDLLDGTAVRFVGSATIGTDHVDLPWLKQQGIGFSNAPGCNANAVVDYVLASLFVCNPDWLQKTVGIIGCGNVGGRLYRRLQALGVATRIYDPFLEVVSNPHLVAFDQVLAADILCLHTPFTKSGPFPTWHMFDANVLNRLAPGTLILNAGRGGVVDNHALLSQLQQGRLQAVLDVWEDEPGISAELLQSVTLGTPHIAGYSLEGRRAGTEMVYQGFLQWSGQTGNPLTALTLADHQVATLAVAETLGDTVLTAYDPRIDCDRLRKAVAANPQNIASQFDSLRKTYPFRREFSHFAVSAELPPLLLKQLSAMGFSC